MKYQTYLSAEGAGVFAVLGDFHLLDGLPEGGTIPGTVLAHDANLLGTLGLKLQSLIIEVLYTNYQKQLFSIFLDNPGPCRATRF